MNLCYQRKHRADSLSPCLFDAYTQRPRRAIAIIFDRRIKDFACESNDEEAKHLPRSQNRAFRRRNKKSIKRFNPRDLNLVRNRINFTSVLLVFSFSTDFSLKNSITCAPRLLRLSTRPLLLRNRTKRLTRQVAKVTRHVYPR